MIPCHYYKNKNSPHTTGPMSRGRESLLSTLKTQKGFLANMKSCAVGDPLRWQWCCNYCFWCCCNCNWWMTMQTKKQGEDSWRCSTSKDGSLSKTKKNSRDAENILSKKNPLSFLFKRESSFSTIDKVPILYYIVFFFKKNDAEATPVFLNNFCS